MLVREKTYEQRALEKDGQRLELHDGVSWEKPPMSFGHNRSMLMLSREFMIQCDPAMHVVSINASRVHRPERTYFIPDIAIIPVVMTEQYRDREVALEVYDQALPLVVEVWSPSTGGYDIDAKLPVYQERGDVEIWRLHPFDRTLTVWRRRPDGSYEQSVHTAGLVTPVALPGVTIDLDALITS